MKRALLLRWLLLGLLGLQVACGDDLLPPLAQPDADVRLELDARKVEAGEPVMATVQVVQAEGVELTVGEPSAEGLEAVLEEERVEPFDGWSLTTLRYALRGEPGSYVVSVGVASALHPDGHEEQLEVPPAFVDVGVNGPNAQLEGLVMPTPPEPARWPWGLLIAAVAAVLGAILGNLWVRRKRATQRVQAEPPHLSALLAWQVVLEDRSLSDHARALQLSEVFRRYLEAVHPMPATALTTREICDAIYADGLVPGALLDRARRILSATDLLKFARRGGGVEFFHELDQDFRGYVLATRPRTPGGGA